MHLHPRLVIILRWAGNVLSIFGIVFVVLRLREYGSEIDFSRLGIYGWGGVAGLVLLYAAANPMLAFAWRNLLAQFGVLVTRRWAFRVYGISQIAKYVPGNIFHLAGRQSLGMAEGLKAMPLLKSTTFELGLIAFAGGLFGFLVLPALIPALSINTAFFLFLAVCFAVFFCLFQYAPLLGRAFCWHVCFLLTTGLVFYGIVNLISDIESSWIIICGAFVLAWLAGLVTPGAPAGVGIRELVLLFLLKGMIVEADLLLAVLMGRVVSVGGDVLFYLVSLAVVSGATDK